MMDRRRSGHQHMAPPPTVGAHGGGAGNAGEPLPKRRPGQVGTYEDVTGQFTVPDGAAYYGAGPPYMPGPGAASGASGLSRDTWVRIIIWVVPLIFMAGTLYFNLQATMARQDAIEDRVRLIADRVNVVASDARVMQEHVMSLRTAGDRIQPQLDGLREQLSGLRMDLAAIREKLGIAGTAVGARVNE